MNRLILSAITLFSALVFNSCEYMTKEPSSAVNVTNNSLLQDSLNKVYPSIRQGQFRAEVKEFQDVTVLLGDKELYSKSDEELQQVASDIGNIVYHIYDANNYLDKGTLVIVESETQIPDENMPKKTFDMHLQDIVKANKK